MVFNYLVMDDPKFKKLKQYEKFSGEPSLILMLVNKIEQITQELAPIMFSMKRLWRGNISVSRTFLTQAQEVAAITSLLTWVDLNTLACCTVWATRSLAIGWIRSPLSCKQLRGSLIKPVLSSMRDRWSQLLVDYEIAQSVRLNVQSLVDFE